MHRNGILSRILTGAISLRPVLTLCFVVQLTVLMITNAAAQETQRLGVVSDQYPSFSPDGKSITFESNRAGPVDQIFVMDLTSGEVTQLTHSIEQNEGPVWSPDGASILFSRRITDTPRTAWDVFSMNRDGLNVRNLTNSPGHDDHPRYSPDGSKIVFNSARRTDFAKLTEHELDNGGYNYDIYIMNADGGEPARLTDYFEWDTYPSISRDGKKLLWRRVLPEGGSGESGLNSEIYMSDIDGKNIKNLTNHPSFDGYPVWSPDGAHIAFASNRDGSAPLEFNIYLMDNKSGAVTRLTETIAGVEQVRPAWSPDGRSIVFNRDFPGGRAEIHVLDLSKNLDAPKSE